MIKVVLITPAGRGSRAGNRATAKRWASLLQSLGCSVRITTPDETPKTHRSGKPPDLVLALHAWRSHAAICAWRQALPGCPLIVVLTGTDVYRFQYTHADTVYASLSAADALIGLHDCLHDDIPAAFRARLHIVHQSAQPLPSKAARRSTRYFDILVAGHLREEKDSLRTAYATRALPANSRMRVIQLGGAHNEQWAQDARDEMARNPRYHWLGDLPRWRVRQWMAKAQLMVISSRMEGGANVVSEACVAGLAIIASDIPGNRGLLGRDYTGYFPVAQSEDLRECLLRAENDTTYLHDLRQQIATRAPLFHPAAEREALARVINSCAIALPS